MKKWCFHAVTHARVLCSQGSKSAMKIHTAGLWKRLRLLPCRPLTACLCITVGARAHELFEWNLFFSLLCKNILIIMSAVRGISYTEISLCFACSSSLCNTCLYHYIIHVSLIRLAKPIFCVCDKMRIQIQTASAKNMAGTSQTWLRP
jgi:hypothetical protein